MAGVRGLRVAAVLAALSMCWAGAPAVGQGVEPGGGQVREYKLVYIDPKDKAAKQKALALPPVPVGERYVKGVLSATKSGNVRGFLLRSDGRLVGLGKECADLVAGFDARHPGATVSDLLRDSDYPTLVLFSDGSLGSVDAKDDEGPSKPVLAPPGRPVRFLDYRSPNVWLLADGRLAAWQGGSEWGFSWGENPKEYWTVSKHRGYAAARVLYIPHCLSWCLEDWYDADEQYFFPTAYAIRDDGRASRFTLSEGGYSFGSSKEVVGGWAKAGSDPNDVKGKELYYGVPSLVKGMRWLSVTQFGRYVVVFLRSDGKLAYRASVSEVRRRAQPPKPAAGLSYVEVEGMHMRRARLALLRSDGRLVYVDPGWGDPETGKLFYRTVPKGLQAPKGWRFLSPTAFLSEWEWGPQNTAPAMIMGVIEKIGPDDPVDSGIKVVKAPSKPVKKGKTVALKVQAVSQANLKGGAIVLTGPTGKKLGQATVTKANGQATIKLNTRALKAGKTPHTLAVQYLGNPMARKSGKAKLKLTITR